jgi:transcriptional regulator with XRE-family HTH domain
MMFMDLGSRLREIREHHNLSQRELAKRAGVTNGTISLIEQNRVSPSVSSLKKVLDGIPMSIADFFTTLDGADTPPTDCDQVFFGADELPELTGSIGRGDLLFRLVGQSVRGRRMQIMRELYHPGADTGAADLLQHDGEEGGIVIRGRVEITVGAQCRVLGPGDAYYFASAIAHRFRNPFAEDCEIISANSPPTF